MSATLPQTDTLEIAKPPQRLLTYFEEGGRTLGSWLLTTDHKRIGILYLYSIVFFFTIAAVAAAMMRMELVTPPGDMVSSETYNKLFTIHGVTMVWFFLIPSIPSVLGNFVVPMMIGARDLAFPRLNLLSWYLFIIGGLLAIYSIAFGGVDTGWTFYEPYSSAFSNTHVVTMVAGIFVAGFSSILTGLNFIVSIHKLRAPGLTCLCSGVSGVQCHVECRGLDPGGRLPAAADLSDLVVETRQKSATQSVESDRPRVADTLAAAEA